MHHYRRCCCRLENQNQRAQETLRYASKSSEQHEPMGVMEQYVSVPAICWKRRHDRNRYNRERHGLSHDNATRGLWLKEREQSLQLKAIKNEEGKTKEKRTKSRL